MSVPTGFCRLTGRVLRMDESVLAGARVTLRASAQRIVAVGGSQRPVYVGDDIECALDESGVLVGPDGDPGVTVLASDGPYSPSGFTWRIQVTAPSIPTQRWSVFATSGETVDLGAAVAVPPDTGQAVIEWRAVRDEVLVARDVVADAVVAVDQDRAWAMAARDGAEQAATRAEVAADDAALQVGLAANQADRGEVAASGAAQSASAALAARDATLAAVVITGVGRPDVESTLSAGNRQLVAAAQWGAVFRSLDGPQGAWQWRKRGTTWVCEVGSTGLRNIDDLLDASKLVEGRATVEREGPRVRVQIRATFADNQAGSVLVLPTGVRKRAGDYLAAVGVNPSDLRPDTTAWVYMANASPLSTIYLRGTNAGKNLVFVLEYLTDNPWPTTLPGTPA